MKNYKEEDLNELLYDIQRIKDKDDIHKKIVDYILLPVEIECIQDWIDKSGNGNGMITKGEIYTCWHITDNFYYIIGENKIVVIFDRTWKWTADKFKFPTKP